MSNDYTDMIIWLKELKETDGKTPEEIARQREIIDSINNGLGDSLIKLI